MTLWRHHVDGREARSDDRSGDQERSAREPADRRATLVGKLDGLWTPCWVQAIGRRNARRYRFDRSSASMTPRTSLRLSTASHALWRSSSIQTFRADSRRERSLLVSDSASSRMGLRAASVSNSARSC